MIDQHTEGDVTAEWERSPRYGGIVGLQQAGLWDQVIDEIDGRNIRIGDRWLVDYASCNYLGLDLDPEVMTSIDAEVRRWGTHPGWSRMLGNPRLYPMIEERLTALQKEYNNGEPERRDVGAVGQERVIEPNL